MNPFLRTLSDAIALNADADTLMSTHLGLEKVGGHIYFFSIPNLKVSYNTSATDDSI